MKVKQPFVFAICLVLFVTAALFLNNKVAKYKSHLSQDFFYRIKACDGKGDPESFYYRLNTCIENDEYDKAIKFFTTAIKNNPRNTAAYFNRGLVYSAKGGYVDSIKIMEVDVDNLYPKKPNFEKAIMDFTKAIELDPKFAEAYANRGSAYSDNGEFSRGEDDYDKAIQLNPTNSKLYLFRATNYCRHDDSEMYNRDFVKAIKLKPWDNEAYFCLLRCAF